MTPRAALAVVVVGAMLLRLAAWRALGGPIIRGDGPAYIEWAQRLAAGDLSGFRDYPLHQLYPALLAPAFAAGVPFEPYVFVLHLALSIGTVLALAYACRQFACAWAAVACAGVAAVYPALLFWCPYVLSETPFFFFLALFLASLSRVLARPRTRATLALPVVTSVLVLVARPVSVALLGVAAIPVAFVMLSDGVGSRRARMVTAVATLAAIAAVSLFLAIDTPARHAVLRYPTVAQSLWLSTRVSSSSISEWTAVSAEHRATVDRFATDEGALWDYKAREAIDFIGAQPGTYALMAVRRFVSYWLPALFADGWSRAHRVFDLIVSLALYLGAAIALYGRRDITRWTLFAVAVALGVLAGLTQVDPDARYRVPAELVLLVLAADGYVRGLSALRARRSRPATA